MGVNLFLSVLLLIGFIGFIVFIVFIVMYNRLVVLRNEIRNAKSSVEVLLKKRHDLIPNLVEIVKGYMKHEQNLLTQIAELRAKAIAGDLSWSEKDKIEGEIGKLLKSIIAVAENYPDLKASANFLHLQATLNEVEEQISAARRFFNASVTEYNNAVKTFPSNFIAQMFNFKEFNWFEVPEEEKQNVNMKDLFKS